MCRSPGCLKRLLGVSSVTLHTCKEEGCVHPVQVKCCDDCFPRQPENKIIINVKQNLSLFLSFTNISPHILLVSDVAGVVNPHQLVGTLTPPRGQMQSHMKAVFSLWRWVPPAEPIPLKLGRFLLTKGRSLQAGLKTDINNSWKVISVADDS